MSLAPLIANADISDGNELPKGAAQFNRIVRLKKDLKVRPPSETATQSENWTSPNVIVLESSTASGRSVFGNRER